MTPREFAFVQDGVSEVLARLVAIYNGRRKVSRLADEVEHRSLPTVLSILDSVEVCELARHGVMIKPELAGLSPDQVTALTVTRVAELWCRCGS